MANINLLRDVAVAREVNAEGIGLYRTEFPFMIRSDFPTDRRTYYMATETGPGGDVWSGGSDTNDGLSRKRPFLTLRRATMQMKGGDTLVIADGTYTGEENLIDIHHRPPNGSPDGYTTIMAEHTGKVTFDGKGELKHCIHLQAWGWNKPACYIHLEGIEWCHSTDTIVRIEHADHITIIRCGDRGHCRDGRGRRHQLPVLHR